MLIKEITDSSHRVTMITGDNPLTACHVASVLRFVEKHREVLILDEPHSSGRADDTTFQWKTVDGQTVFTSLGISEHFISSKKQKEFLSKYELCLTGAGLEHLWGEDKRLAMKLLPSVRVFARMSPKVRATSQRKGVNCLGISAKGDGCK